MKRFLCLFVFMFMLSACMGDGNPSDATILPNVTQSSAATEPPAPTAESPVAVEPSPTLVSINLAGPPMELGSKYRYVDGSVLAAVPGGEFTMGYYSSDNPIHKVTLSEFWIYSTKITNQQYALCVQAGKCTSPDPQNAPHFGDARFINFPVTGVNYDQAAAYCSFVNGRLPTEAEWEKTARGPDGNLFPWGNEGPVCDLLNFKFCEGTTTEVIDYPQGVSYFGALDMAGNAREWVADWYSPTYYSEAPVEDPLGPLIGEKRSVRGSSYRDGADPSLSAHRFSLLPTENLPDLGFRCIVDNPTHFAPACEQLAFVGAGPIGESATCTPDVQCNKVGISQAPNCTGKPDFIAYTIVTFSLSNTPPDMWTYDVPGCSSPVGAEKNKFQCDYPGDYTASVEGSCVDVNACASACPAHYTMVGDACVWDGASTDGTACMAGTVYDPLNHCCVAESDSVVNYNICPTGYYPLNGACVENSKKIVDSKLQAVMFNNGCAFTNKRSCDPSKDPACAPSEVCLVTSNAGCKPPWFWDGKCSCRLR
ncbi:MAG: SUMF1/EgtB/PvdO family nonheme iron enzyme [Chloroflexi bacterium]|nr:SUMF1/EgtB/PvdO family nonheme iron enzyme [Chloroflexota bacterium]